MSATEPGRGETVAPPARRVFWVLAPVAVFVVLVGFFLAALQSEGPSIIPSPLVGGPAPQFVLPPLEGLRRAGTQMPGFESGDLAKGEVTLVNVWASWCVPCRAEHPLLTALAKQGEVKIYGLNYKDKPENALRFLGTLGNPYDRVGTDQKGRTSIDWGVYGIPETFIVDGQGVVRHKIVGQLTQSLIERRLKPQIALARQKLPEK
ncbi:MAG: DsbE family thiol:disulfide interchange protein [Alphaproteobacteria bacterium]